MYICDDVYVGSSSLLSVVLLRPLLRFPCPLFVVFPVSHHKQRVPLVVSLSIYVCVYCSLSITISGVSTCFGVAALTASVCHVHFASIGGPAMPPALLLRPPLSLPEPFSLSSFRSCALCSSPFCPRASSVPLPSVCASAGHRIKRNHDDEERTKSRASLCMLDLTFKELGKSPLGRLRQWSWCARCARAHVHGAKRKSERGSAHTYFSIRHLKTPLLRTCRRCGGTSQ